MSKFKKSRIILASSLIVSFCLFSAAYAASTGTKKVLDAYYGARIVYNNQELLSDVQPFIVKGTTYVPLRLVMNSFNKDISWDDVNSKVIIKDKPNETETALRTELASKDVKISELEAVVKELQKKLSDAKDSSSSSSSGLSSLEDDLNHDYKKYESKSFEIILGGDKNDVNVKIDVSSTDWDSLSSSKQTTLLKNICSNIRDEYDGAQISGCVRSNTSSSTFLYFYRASNGDIKTNSTEGILDFEQKLDENYSDYFDKYDIPLSVTLSGSSSDITFKVNVKYDKYDDEWDDLSDSKIKTLMSSIYDELEDKFKNADIEGYVYDTDNSKNLAKYYRSSSGSANFTRY